MSLTPAPPPAEEPMKTHTKIVLLIVGFIGVVLVVCVIGVISLALQATPIPDALIAISSGALGALGTLLARTGTEPGGGGTKPIPMMARQPEGEVEIHSATITGHLEEPLPGGMPDGLPEPPPHPGEDPEDDGEVRFPEAEDLDIGRPPPGLKLRP